MVGQVNEDPESVRLNSASVMVGCHGPVLAIPFLECMTHATSVSTFRVEIL